VCDVVTTLVTDTIITPPNRLMLMVSEVQELLKVVCCYNETTIKKERAIRLLLYYNLTNSVTSV